MEFDSNRLKPPRKRSLSESSSNSSSSSSSSEDEGGPEQPRVDLPQPAVGEQHQQQPQPQPRQAQPQQQHREKSPARKSKRARLVSDAQFEFLQQQVAFLTNIITYSQASKINESLGTNANCTPVTSSNNNVSTNSTNQSALSTVSVTQNETTTGTENNSGLLLAPPNGTDIDKNSLKLSDPCTVVKDPIYPKANDNYLKKLIDLQRFKSNDWNAIRFSEVQKKYISTPGFVELGINDELKRFGSQSSEEYRLHLMERSFAALTSAILTQKDELCQTLQGLIDWAGNNETALNPKSLFLKIEEAFNKQSPYMKVTDDILQMVCGRRADLIQSRRDLLVNQIPDEYHCEALKRIPPNAEFLFDVESINTYIQKIGGAEKLSAVSSTQSTPRSTNGNNNQPRKYDDSSKPSTSKQSSEKPFRNNPPKKGKSNKSKSGTSNKSAIPKSRQSSKGKKSRSDSPSKYYKGRRA